MRQLARGVLATLLLAMAACGGGDDPVDGSSADRPLDGAALAAASEISTPTDAEPSAASIMVTVTSPEGIDAPGLDAAISVLVGRPDLDVDVIAPAADATADVDRRATGALAAVDVETMTGHAARAVNGSMLDVLDVLITSDRTPDLLVIGLTADAGPASAAMAGARLALEHDISVLLVDVDGTDPDLAGAGLLLGTVVDYELDGLVAEPSVHRLSVPACSAGTVRGPALVDPAPVDAPTPTIDCTSPDTGPFDDELDAWAAGHATLAALDTTYAIP